MDPLSEQALIDLEYTQLRNLVTFPYLPPITTQPKYSYKEVYTLVLDLDETLIHFEIDEEIDPAVEEPGYYLIRPGAMNFLSELSQYYEIVVFTAAMPDVSSLFNLIFLVRRLDP